MVPEFLQRQGLVQAGRGVGALPSWCPQLGAQVSEAVTITPIVVGSLQGQERAGGLGRRGLVTSQSLGLLVTPAHTWVESQPFRSQAVILGVTSALGGLSFSLGQRQR